MVVTEPWALFAAVGDDRGTGALVRADPRRGAWAYPAATLALWLRAGGRPARRAGRSRSPSARACSPCCPLAARGALRRAGVRPARARLADGADAALALLVDDAGTGSAPSSLGVGALIALVAFLGHRSDEWEVATTLWKERMVEYGSWAGGAFAIGIGVLPAIALLAVLAVPRSERARPGVRAFVVVAGGAVVSFGWYAAIKGAYLSTAFSSLDRRAQPRSTSRRSRSSRPRSLERAAAPVWAVLIARRRRPRDDRVGADRPRPRQLPVLRGARARDPRAREPRAGLAARSHRARARRRRARPVAALLLAVAHPLPTLVARRSAARGRRRGRAVLAWNVTAEVYAAIGEHDFSARVEANLPKPNDWVDRAAGDGTVVYARPADDRRPDRGDLRPSSGTGRSAKVWSVDGTGPGPGHTLTPDLAGRRRDAVPDPETDYVLATNGVEVVGRRSSREPGGERHARPARRPDPAPVERDGDRGGRLDARRSPSDETVPARAAYNRFDVSRTAAPAPRRDALARDVLPAGRPPCRASRRSGSASSAAGRTSNRRSSRETASETVYVPACAVRTVVLPTPTGPGASRSRSTPSCPPRSTRALGSERRALGARVSFDVVPLARRAATRYVKRDAEREPRERARALERAFRSADRRRRSRCVCGTKNGRSSTRANPAARVARRRLDTGTAAG